MSYFTVTTKQLVEGLSAIPTLLLHREWTMPDHKFVEVWAPAEADRLVFSAHNSAVALSVSLPLAWPNGNGWEARAVVTVADMSEAFNHVADWALADMDGRVRVGIFGDTVTFDVDHGQSVTLLGVPEPFPQLGRSLGICGPGAGRSVSVREGRPQTRDGSLTGLEPNQHVGGAMAVLACTRARLTDVKLWPQVEDPECSHGWFTSTSEDGLLSVYGAI